MERGSWILLVDIGKAIFNYLLCNLEMLELFSSVVVYLLYSFKKNPNWKGTHPILGLVISWYCNSKRYFLLSLY